MDPTIVLLNSIISLGFSMNVKTEKAVRDGRDVMLVKVSIGDDFTGEGLTPSDALTDACMKMRKRVEARHLRDAAILEMLPAPEQSQTSSAT